MQPELSSTLLAHQACDCPALVHILVSWSAAENCTLEPVVLRQVATILSILRLLGGGLGALAPKGEEVVEMF